jgi:hypothetical protein
MDVSLYANISTLSFNVKKEQNSLGIKNLYTDKVQGEELKELKQQVEQNAHAFTFNIEITQVTITNLGENDDEFLKAYEEFQKFLDDIGYEGKKIADLTQDEAKELVSEDGFFGIKQTSQRIADFVIKGANGDEDLLRAGLDGIMQGFKEAEEIWGEKLPDISYKTIDRAKELIANEMNKLGINILDTSI